MVRVNIRFLIKVQHDFPLLDSQICRETKLRSRARQSMRTNRPPGSSDNGNYIKIKLHRV